MPPELNEFTPEELESVQRELVLHGVEQHNRRIREKLFQYNREPFLDVLATVMGAAPTPEAIQQFANKAPDRWAQALTILSRLWGFNEKLEISHTHVIDIQAMSDMALLKRARELGIEDAEFVEVDVDGPLQLPLSNPPKDNDETT